MGNTTSIRSTDFGTLPDGREARLYRLANGRGMTLDVTDIGGCIVSLCVPDREGSPVDVVMGYGNSAGYAVNGPNFGAPVGRHANRIGGASFELDGTSYQLADIEKGNSLHSGPDMWFRRSWEVVRAEQANDAATIELHLLSPDGDQGFPGELDMHVCYTIDAAGRLRIRYEGTPSARTIVNLTNHSYFNLNGHASGTVLDHTLSVNADAYTPTDTTLVPTGEIASVEGTPLDLRIPHPLHEGVESGFAPIAAAGGFDHNYVLPLAKPTEDGWSTVGSPRCVATLTGDKSGIVMNVVTDTPGMQVYTGNFLEGEVGKGGTAYHDHDAVCLETQFFPDAIHHDNFAQPVFGPGRPYRSETVFEFSAA